jgi:hypothetical protein
VPKQGSVAAPVADRVAAGLSCYRGKRRLLRCGGWEGEQVSAVSAGRRRHDQHGNPAGDRVDRDDSLFPLGSGPLYLGWDPRYRRATLAACRPSSWCGKVFRLFGLGGAATK